MSPGHGPFTVCRDLFYAINYRLSKVTKFNPSTPVDWWYHNRLVSIVQRAPVETLVPARRHVPPRAVGLDSGCDTASW